MPVYLPPINRRRFLTQTFLAGAGLMLRPCLRADGQAGMAQRWVLISDTHIAADLTAVVRQQNMAANLAAVVKEVLTMPLLPDGVIINGDLAFKHGKTEDYEAFVSLIHPFRDAGVPVVLTLGNHDDREAFRHCVPEAAALPRPVLDRQVMMVRTPAMNWFLLDSLEKTNSSPGRLGETQLQWLAQELDANADKPAIVVVHHHPDPGGDKIALIDTPELWAVIRPRHQVKAYVYGHTHVWRVDRDPSGIHLINLPPTSYLFKPGGAIGWTLATLGSAGIQFELHCLDRTHPGHGQVIDLHWRSDA